MSETKFSTILNVSRKPKNGEEEKEKISSLPSECFFNYSFLLELDLSYNNLSFLPLSISQCFLLERVNISHNPMTMPPLVLFSLPKIRKNPENVIFGNDQHCTRKMMYEILKQSQLMNQLSIQFIEPDTSVSIISVAAETTLYELLVLTHPELSHIASYLFIVRSFKNHDLMLTPDAMPIAPYFYPGATWSLELRFIPPVLTPSIVPLLRHFVVQQLVIHKDDELLKHCSESIPCDCDVTNQDLRKISEKFAESPLLSARHYIAYLDNGKKLDIGASIECISIRPKDSMNYIVLKPNSISFDCVNTIFLMVCGSSAVKLNKSTAVDLLPLFALAVERWENPTNDDDSFIDDLVADAEESVASIANRSKPRIISDDTIDSVLKKLKSFESEKVMFAPKV